MPGIPLLTYIQFHCNVTSLVIINIYKTHDTIYKMSQKYENLKLFSVKFLFFFSLINFKSLQTVEDLSTIVIIDTRTHQTPHWLGQACHNLD